MFLSRRTERRERCCCGVGIFGSAVLLFMAVGMGGESGRREGLVRRATVCSRTNTLEEARFALQWAWLVKRIESVEACVSNPNVADKESTVTTITA